TDSPDPDAAFAYGSSRSWEVARFECSLDGAEFAECPFLGVSYEGLADGPHHFSVRAVSTEGEIDASPADWKWTIDTVPPGTALLDGPGDLEPSSSAWFDFAADPL